MIIHLVRPTGMDIVTVVGILRGTMVVMAGTARGTIPGMHHGMILGTIPGTIQATTAGHRLGAMVGTAAITIVLGDTMDGTDLIIIIMVVAAIARQHTNASMPIVM